VVPVRNGEAAIAECIEALLSQDYPAEQRQIVVVDNGSRDRTAEIARTYPVTCVSEPRRGVSNARNCGIRAASGELIALLDGDCIPEPGWLRELVAPFEDPEVGCVGGELVHGALTTAAERQSARILGNWQRHAISADPPYVVTANAALRRSALEGVNGFDPRMTRAQDVDLGLRLSEHGVEIAYREGARAAHRHPSTQRAFLRQQLGWAYGAGLLEAKRRTAGHPRNDLPRFDPLVASARGLVLVARERLRGRARPEWLEEAWFNLLRALAWSLGGWAGLAAGRSRFRR
jgi:cellulose synthase/poly-beta-1,6-N-acetylglucosamine synthase-like glycosyltransferase